VQVLQSRAGFGAALTLRARARTGCATRCRTWRSSRTLTFSPPATTWCPALARRPAATRPRCGSPLGPFREDAWGCSHHRFVIVGSARQHGQSRSQCCPVQVCAQLMGSCQADRDAGSPRERCCCCVCVRTPGCGCPSQAAPCMTLFRSWASAGRCLPRCGAPERLIHSLGRRAAAVWLGLVGRRCGRLTNPS